MTMATPDDTGTGHAQMRALNAADLELLAGADDTGRPSTGIPSSQLPGGPEAPISVTAPRTPAPSPVPGDFTPISYPSPSPGGGSSPVQDGDFTVEARNWTSKNGKNNPGNITVSKFTQSLGEKGAVGTIGSFDTEQHGRDAMGSLLSGSAYNSLSVNDAIAKYAPASAGNDVPAYQSDVDSRIGSSGASGDTVINSMNNDQFNSLLDAITIHEGVTNTN